MISSRFIAPCVPQEPPGFDGKTAASALSAAEVDAIFRRLTIAAITQAVE